MTPDDRSTHDVVQELLSLYALDTATPDEARQVERHVARCAACHAELQTLLEAAGALRYAAPQQAMPASVRASVLAAIDDVEGVERPAAAVTAAPVRTRANRIQRWRRSSAAFGAMAACLALVVVALGVQTARLQQQDDPTSNESSIAATMTGSSHIIPIRTSGKLEGVDAEYADVHGVGMIVTKGLPKAPDGYTYRVWGVTPAKDMHPMGELAPHTGRDAMALQAVDAPRAGEVASIEITLEPESATPTQPDGAVVGRATMA